MIGNCQGKAEISLHLAGRAPQARTGFWLWLRLPSIFFNDQRKSSVARHQFTTNAVGHSIPRPETASGTSTRSLTATDAGCPRAGPAAYEAKAHARLHAVATVVAAANGNPVAQWEAAQKGKSAWNGAVSAWNGMSTTQKSAVATEAILTVAALVAGGRISGPVAEPSVLRVTTPGVPAFQLRQGEQGLSVFDAAKVGESDILPSFREGSGITSRSVSDIQARGLTVEPTPGDPSLPQKLQDAHMEIRPGEDMTRKEFKQAIKGLNDDEQ